jgi:ATP-dependent Zn protease
VITRYRNKLKVIADLLREEETLDADQFESIFADLPPHSKLVLTRQPVPA